MTGLEVIRIIKRTRPKIPLIVISDDASIETGGRIMQEGVFYYSIKPLDAEELSQAIQAALSYVEKSYF